MTSRTIRAWRKIGIRGRSSCLVAQRRAMAITRTNNSSRRCDCGLEAEGRLPITPDIAANRGLSRVAQEPLQSGLQGNVSGRSARTTEPCVERVSGQSLLGTGLSRFHDEFVQPLRASQRSAPAAPKRPGTTGYGRQQWSPFPPPWWETFTPPNFHSALDYGQFLSFNLESRSMP